MLVLFLLAPSGLWMAYYAETGAVAAVGFSLLAIATAICVMFGWQSAVKRRFAEHRRWMLRCFWLLCSAVMLRILGGLATITGAGDAWSYPLAAWVSWLAPLVAFELSGVIRIRYQRWKSSCGVKLMCHSPGISPHLAVAIINDDRSDSTLSAPLNPHEGLL